MESLFLLLFLLAALGKLLKRRGETALERFVLDTMVTAFLHTFVPGGTIEVREDRNMYRHYTSYSVSREGWECSSSEFAITLFWKSDAGGKNGGVDYHVRFVRGQKLFYSTRPDDMQEVLDMVFHDMCRFMTSSAYA